MRNISLAISCLLAICFACEDDITRTQVGKVKIVVGDGATKSFSKDAFELRAVGLVDNQLKIHVSYGGGCEPHDFSLKWDGKWTEEDGIETAQVYVVHRDLNNDGCEAYLSETLSIELTDLIPAGLNASSRIQFINASDESRTIYLMQDFIWSSQSSDCELELVLEEVICGLGEWENRWFVLDNDGSHTRYLQPVEVPMNSLNPEAGKTYRIGVEYLFGSIYDGVTCAAFSGPYQPVRINCIEEVP